MALGRLVFTNPSGWWALAAVAAVVALYLLYRRFRPLPVTGLFLWGETRRDGGGGSRIEKPLRNRSFWLDVTAAALLAAALAGPGWRVEKRVRVMVLDNSIAMRARGAHEAAVARIVSLWSSDDPAALLFAGPEPVLARDAIPASRSEIEAWLAAAYRPAESGADLGKALQLAREVYGDGLDIHVFSNQHAPVLPAGRIPVTVHTFAGRGGNLSFEQIWRRDSDRGEEIFALVVNHGDGPVQAEVTLTTNAEPPLSLYRNSAILPPGLGELRIPCAGFHDAVLVLNLAAAVDDDVIELDSTAWLPPQPKGMPNYEVSGLDEASEHFISLALVAAGCERATEDTVPELLVTGEDSARGSLATLHLPPAEEPGYLTPPYLVDFDSPLCRDVDVSASAWVVANRDVPDHPEEVFIAAGPLPLYWREGVRYFLNVSPNHGGLVREPAWPVLMGNLAAQCRLLRPGPGQTTYSPGAAAGFVRSPGQTGALTLTGEDGRITSTTSGRVIPVSRQAGLYRIALDGKPAGELSVLPLYGEAADTRRLAPATKTHTVGGDAAMGEGVDDLRGLALALACAALACNWFLGRKSGRDG